MSVDLLSGRAVGTQTGDSTVPFSQIGIEIFRTVESPAFKSIALYIAAGILSDAIFIGMTRPY